MSCKHGNHERGCDLCDAESEAYQLGYEAGKASQPALREIHDCLGLPEGDDTDLQVILLTIHDLRTSHPVALNLSAALEELPLPDWEDQPSTAPHRGMMAGAYRQALIAAANLVRKASQPAAPVAAVPEALTPEQINKIIDYSNALEYVADEWRISGKDLMMLVRTAIAKGIMEKPEGVDAVLEKAALHFDRNGGQWIGSVVSSTIRSMKSTYTSAAPVEAATPDCDQGCKTYGECKAVLKCHPGNILAAPAAVVGQDAGAVDSEALRLLGEVFDAWENGDECYENGEANGCYMGMAFRLDDDTFKACCDLLNRFSPKIKNATPAQAVQAYRPPEDHDALEAAAYAVHGDEATPTVSESVDTPPTIQELWETIREVIRAAEDCSADQPPHGAKARYAAEYQDLDRMTCCLYAAYRALEAEAELGRKYKAIAWESPQQAAQGQDGAVACFVSRDVLDTVCLAEIGTLVGTFGCKTADRTTPLYTRPQPPAQAMADAVAAMNRAKALPVWDGMNYAFHVELDKIFRAILTAHREGSA